MYWNMSPRKWTKGRRKEIACKNITQEFKGTKQGMEKIPTL